MKIINEILIKSMYSLVIIVIGLIPLWIFLLSYFLLFPQGFWQNIIYGIGLYFLGGIQFILLILLFGSIYKIWYEF